MKSVLPLLLLVSSCSLLLFGHTGAAARTDAAEYWRAAAVMKEKNGCLEKPAENPEVLKEKTIFVNLGKNQVLEPEEDEKMIKDFEPRPNLSAYGGDDDKKRIMVKDFESHPNLSAYGDGDKKESNDADKRFVFETEFEPRPSASAYNE